MRVFAILTSNSKGQVFHPLSIGPIEATHAISCGPSAQLFPLWHLGGRFPAKTPAAASELKTQGFGKFCHRGGPLWSPRSENRGPFDKPKAGAGPPRLPDRLFVVPHRHCRPSLPGATPPAMNSPAGADSTALQVIIFSALLRRLHLWFMGRLPDRNGRFLS